MSVGAYVGINNSAKKIHNIYVGIDNVSRRVKMAYVGIGGVARPFLCEYNPSHYGTITELGESRHTLSATNVGQYALFAGGYIATSPYASSLVDVYDQSRTKRMLSLCNHRYGMFSYRIGGDDTTTFTERACFAGGRNDSSVCSNFDVYNQSLTHTHSGDVLFQRYNGSCARFGGSAYLFGGRDLNGIETSSITCHNASGTASNYRTLPFAISDSAASANDNFVIVAGGWSSSAVANASAWNLYGTQLYPASLSEPRCYLSSGHINGNIVFAGGLNGSSVSNIVDVYTSSLTKATASPLSVARQGMAATHVGDYLLFAGGSDYSMPYSVVDVYDKSLTKSVTTSLSVARTLLAATSIGHYAIFAGGAAIDGLVDTVDLYVAS